MLTYINLNLTKNNTLILMFKGVKKYLSFKQQTLVKVFLKQLCLKLFFLKYFLKVTNLLIYHTILIMLIVF